MNKEKVREKMSQNQSILKYLRAGNSLTGLDALKLFGTMKLASRISEIRDEGIEIKDKVIHGENKKHYKKYWIEIPEPPRTETEGEYR